MLFIDDFSSLDMMDRAARAIWPKYDNRNIHVLVGFSPESPTNRRDTYTAGIVVIDEKEEAEASVQKLSTFFTWQTREGALMALWKYLEKQQQEILDRAVDRKN